MNALLVGMEWFPSRAGGLNRYFYEEVHALPNAGVTGSAIVTALEAGHTAPMALEGMAQPDASLVGRLAGVRRVVRERLRADPDIVNAHFALYAYPWLGLLNGRAPLIVNFHGPWTDEILAESPTARGRMRAILARRIERKVYRRAERVITLSNSFGTIVHERYGVPFDRVRVIPGGVDLRPYLAAPERSTARVRLGWPSDRKILLSVRRLARRMGLETLIDSMADVLRFDPRALLLIGGKGAIAGELQERIHRIGLDENVKLLGFIPDADLPLAYAAADLTIVPTVALEGFGLVTVESLASGTPVIGTRVGGTPEILDGLDSHLLFESGTPQSMAQRIIDALGSHPDLPDAKACRAYAMQYGWDVVAPRIRTVFEEAISERRGLRSEAGP